MARFSISATGQITHGDPVIGRPDVQQRPLSYVGVGLVAPSRRPASSTVVRRRPQIRAARDWLHFGYIGGQNGAEFTLSAQKERRRKAWWRLEFQKAEGTGLEPATPCGAPHFQCVPQRDILRKESRFAGTRSTKRSSHVGRAKFPANLVYGTAQQT